MMKLGLVLSGGGVRGQLEQLDRAEVQYFHS